MYRKNENLHEVNDLRDEVLNVLKGKTLTVEQLEELIAPRDQELFIDVVREMVDEGLLVYDAVWKLALKKQKR
jgi:ATP-dependent DNA helicase RecQ